MAIDKNERIKVKIIGVKAFCSPWASAIAHKMKAGKPQHKAERIELNANIQQAVISALLLLVPVET